MRSLLILLALCSPALAQQWEPATITRTADGREWYHDGTKWVEVTRTQCYGGQCNPNGIYYRQVPQQQPQEWSQPAPQYEPRPRIKAGPVTVPPSASDGQALLGWRDQMEKQIKDLKAQVGACQQMCGQGKPGPAGPPGPQRPVGPAGGSGPAPTIDYSKLQIDYSKFVIDYDKLGAAIAKNTPTQPTPTDQGKQHIVIAVDRNSSWWPRLSEEITRTLDTYKGIRVSGLPENYSGEIPVAVIYENSIPVRVVPGERDVLDLLSRVRRGAAI